MMSASVGTRRNVLVRLRSRCCCVVLSPLRRRYVSMIYWSLNVIARVNIGFEITLLARFSDPPNKIHFDSLRRLARFLRMTKNWGMMYWRLTPLASMPTGSFTALASDQNLPTIDITYHNCQLCWRRSCYWPNNSPIHFWFAFMICSDPITCIQIKGSINCVH